MVMLLIIFNFIHLNGKSPIHGNEQCIFLSFNENDIDKAPGIGTGISWNK